MSARAIQKGLDKALIVSRVIKSGTTTIVGVGLKDTGATFWDNCGAGDNPDCLPLEVVVGDGVKSCQCIDLTSGGVIAMVKVNGTATRGGFAECAASGFTNRATLGGGTVVRHIAGYFEEDGVDGDFVGLRINRFSGVSA